jgi:hypothetical protein
MDLGEPHAFDQRNVSSNRTTISGTALLIATIRLSTLARVQEKRSVGKNGIYLKRKPRSNTRKNKRNERHEDRYRLRPGL